MRPQAALSARRGRLDEVPVRRHGIDAFHYRRARLLEPGLDLPRREPIDQRVVATRNDVLTDHDREPAEHGEKVGLLAEDTAVAAKELDLLAQAFGQRDVAAVLPER